MDTASTILRIPSSTILTILFSFIISVAVPIALLVYIRIKYKAKISSFFIGAATFIVFAMILEGFLHMLVLNRPGSVSTAITESIWLSALYGGLAAGIFEETGRFFSMKFLMKKNLTSENALMYGAGHGGIEAIIVVGITFFSYLLNALLLNAGTLDSMLSGELGADILAGFEPLATLPSWHFAMAGAERLSAILLHIALSMIIYLAIREKKEISYYLLAVGLHALVDFVVVLIASMLSILLVELILFIMCVIAAVIAYRLWKARTVPPADKQVI